MERLTTLVNLVCSYQLGLNAKCEHTDTWHKADQTNISFRVTYSDGVQTVVLCQYDTNALNQAISNDAGMRVVSTLLFLNIQQEAVVAYRDWLLNG